MIIDQLRKPAFRRGVMLAAYTVLIAVLSSYHEMWRDEVRALTVATDPTSWQAMFAELHHEGHPTLWYIVLRAGYFAAHSQFVLPLAAGLAGIVSAWLI